MQMSSSKLLPLRKHKTYQLRVWIGPDYSVCAPDLPGCISQGTSYADCIHNIKDAFVGLEKEYVAQGVHVPFIEGDCRPQFHEEVRIIVEIDRGSVECPADWPPNWPPRYNASSTPCDMAQGPCSCGAWHTLAETQPKPVSTKVNYELAQDICNMLNEALVNDREALTHLIRHEAECTDILSEHPTIQVSTSGERHYVSMLGLLNGLCGVDDQGRGPIIAILCDNSLRELVVRKKPK
jgi:predicted RNase H-like HicB family nuclease